MTTITIGTACDSGYVWGAWLLGASLQRNRVAAQLTVFGKGLSPQDIALLTQFERVQVRALDIANPRSLCLRKPEVLLGQEGEFVSWMDADCMAVGDIGPLLLPEGGDMQVRLRRIDENASVWGRDACPTDAYGAIPAHVLSRWQADVGGLDQPRIPTTCVTHAFVLHRRHLPFVERWKAQMDRVLDISRGVVVDKKNPFYRMTDESVLSSLMMFDPEAPFVAPYRLDLPGAYIAHFGENPKPWGGWTARAMLWYDCVMATIAWAQQEGLSTPPIPPSLEPGRRSVHRAQAELHHLRRTVHAQGGTMLRALGLR